MFKEVIEEITKRLNHLESMKFGFDVKEEAIAVEVTIQTYESVLELIESCKPKSQVLDNPDSWGRWLNVNTWGHVAYFDVIEKDNVFFVKTDEETKPVSEIGGLWIHVLLETDKPKWVDKPDSEGWWWTFESDRGLYDCFHVVESEGELMVRDIRRSLYIRMSSGLLSDLKWIKAYPPEME